MKTLFALAAVATLSLAAPAFAQSTSGQDGSSNSGSMSHSTTGVDEGRAAAPDSNGASSSHTMPSNNPDSSNPARSNGN